VQAVHQRAQHWQEPNISSQQETPRRECVLCFAGIAYLLQVLLFAEAAWSSIPKMQAIRLVAYCITQ
jgi:hypothetical protein